VVVLTVVSAPMSRRILLVDDEVAILRTLELILQQHGFQVTAVSSVPDALTAIARQAFDILVTDLNIGQPGDGFTVVSAMRRTYPDALTLILTGFPAFDRALQAIREQVDDFLVKPIHPDEL
jgi:DNA-binding NtrC family response regulator